MNERIKELVVKSGNGLMRDGKLYPHIGSRTQEDWEKFAELIVRECVDCLNPLSRNHSMVGAAQDTIKEHFGVEE